MILEPVEAELVPTGGEQALHDVLMEVLQIQIQSQTLEGHYAILVDAFLMNLL